MERFDPVKFLIDKRKDIGFDETQRAQLETLHKALKPRWDSVYKKFDSTQVATRAFNNNTRAIPGSPRSLADQAKIKMGQNEAQTLLVQIREDYTKGETDAMAMLRDDQRVKAKALLDKLHEEMTAEALGRARIPRDPGH